MGGEHASAIGISILVSDDGAPSTAFAGPDSRSESSRPKPVTTREISCPGSPEQPEHHDEASSR